MSSAYLGSPSSCALSPSKGSVGLGPGIAPSLTPYDVPGRPAAMNNGVRPVRVDTALTLARLAKSNRTFAASETDHMSAVAPA